MMDMIGYMASSQLDGTRQNSQGASSGVEMARDGEQSTVSTHREWRYEMRREAQQILPGLLLGPFQASTNANRLRALGVTHILCVRDTREVNIITPRFPGEFIYMTLEIEDNEDQNLIKVFPRSSAFIENARASGGTVLVHCNGGFALSPAIVAGYIIELRQCTWSIAVHFLRTRRYCISFNAGYENQLREYEVVCRAKAAMLEHAQEDTSQGVSKPKRRMSQEDDLPRAGPGIFDFEI